MTTKTKPTLARARMLAAERNSSISGEGISGGGLCLRYGQTRVTIWGSKAEQARLFHLVLSALPVAPDGKRRARQ